MSEKQGRERPQFKPSNPDNYRTEASLFALEQASEIINRLEKLDLDKQLKKSISHSVNDAFAAQEDQLTRVFIAQLEQIQEKSSDPLGLRTHETVSAKKDTENFFKKTGSIWFFITCCLLVWIIFDITSYIFK